MMRHQWNSLRVGDAVLLHTESGDVVAGTVRFVTVAEGPDDDNAVGMRVQELDETYYAWPTLSDVHAENDEEAATCAHCRLVDSLEPNGAAT